MVRIRFKYRDEFCRDGRWNEQECLVHSVEECKKIYGLDQCEHEILEDTIFPDMQLTQETLQIEGGK